MNHVNQGKSYLLLISILILALFLTACGKATGTVGNNKEINIGYQ
ncbi:hypothetical protein ACQKGD_09410 [Peribacillus frigoritolerans]|nr:hypothetical protein [Peribacillus frigoritolerans]